MSPKKTVVFGLELFVMFTGLPKRMGRNAPAACTPAWLASFA